MIIIIQHDLLFYFQLDACVFGVENKMYICTEVRDFDKKYVP